MRTNSAENKSLFTGYSKKKLYCLAETYEELAKLYRGKQNAAQIPVGKDALDRRDILYRKELCETNHIFANHLEEISEAFLEVADTVVHVSKLVEHKRKALVQHLKKHGIQARELIFIEGGASRRISMEARSLIRREIPADDLAGLLSVYFNRRLMPSLDSAMSLGRGYNLFIFEDEPCFMVLSAVSRAVKEDEKISGDNFSVEEYSHNQMVAMISDGMGSGEQACHDSRSVIEFMEKFLEAGFSREKALMMVNGALFSQNPGGNLTTLDICSIDLFSGEADFVKTGAAASFLKRGMNVEEIVSDTLPLGSVEEINAMQLMVQLRNADMLVMVSDGVTDAFGEFGTRRLKDIIAKTNYVNPKELSDHLLKCAIGCQGGHIRDDMTVLAMYINQSNDFTIGEMG
ncbi:MAG: SpoIIE family protein phosphatase [Lachnospiraceae bacterium]|nr:SpoIIE family protein phosphatase [Lachnospiraceae bacterium]